MAGSNYYLVSALPTLGALGAAPPITPADLREHVSPSRRAVALVEAILLGDDLQQREAALAGEIEKPAPAVLTPGQILDEEPLPPFLAVEGDTGGHRLASDALWAAYFRHAAGVASVQASEFLTAWIGYEVALRNALVTARAKALGLEAAEYLVTPDLGAEGDDFAPLLLEWTAAATPLEGLKILDRGRWQWLADHEAWFTFADDELAVYAARLMLLVRWHRLEQS